jgi:hypothetical protein
MVWLRLSSRQEEHTVATQFEDHDTPALPFGAWLLQQKDKGGLIGQLADGAAQDRRFPKHGDVEAVRKHLSAMQAEGDMFAAIDDAELDYLCA